MMRYKGFTLIELLVVIAIIAILAAILFPVFAKVREKARQTSCASNEKQIALGILQYVEDYDEYFPPQIVGKDPVSFILWPSAINPYIKSAGVYSCPDDTYGNNFTNPLNWDRDSYGLNCGLSAGSRNKAISQAEVNNPSSLCLLAEDWLNKIPNQGGGYYIPISGPPDDVVAPFSTANGGPGGYPEVWYSGGDTPTVNDPDPNGTDFALPLARHSGGANIAFTDGHVKLVQYNNIMAPPAGTALGQFELWDPQAN